MSSSRHLRLALGLVIAGGLALRLTGLGTQSLWLDEMTSIDVAGRPLGQILAGGGFDNHTPPLYYLLLHGWFRVLPATEVTLRLFSALIEPVNMALLAQLCLRFLSPAHTLLIAAAYAVSPFMLYYAQEGRMYTLVVFLALLYVCMLDRLAQASRPLVPWALLTGVVLALGLYTHYVFAFFGAAALSAYVYLTRHSRRHLGSVMLSGAIAAALFAPWLPVVVRLAESGGQAFRTFLWSVIPYTVFRFAAGYAIFPINVGTKEAFARSVAQHLPALAATFGIVALLAIAGITSWRSARPPAVGLSAWLMLAPMALGLIISLRTPMLSERYLILVLPFFLVFLLGFLDLRRTLPAVAAALFFALSLAGVLAYFLNPEFGKAQWRDAARYVAGTAHRGDIVLVEPDFTAGVLSYYLGDRPAVQALPVQRVAAGRIWDAGRLRETLSPYRRVILVTAGGLSESAYAPALSQVATRAQIKVFPLETGITCTVWTLPTSPGA